MWINSALLWSAHEANWWESGSFLRGMTGRGLEFCCALLVQIVGAPVAWKMTSSVDHLHWRRDAVNERALGGAVRV